MLLQVLTFIILVILGGLSHYLKYNVTLKDKVIGLINQAEALYKETTQSGSQKFQWVVNTLYDFVPIQFKFIFTKEKIGVMVQSVFDHMEAYVVHQLDKTTANIDLNKK